MFKETNNEYVHQLSCRQLQCILFVWFHQNIFWSPPTAAEITERDRPYSYGSRIPKTTPRHQTSANTYPKEPVPLPTHSTSRVSASASTRSLPTNNRLDFLDKPSTKPLAKKGFVAMPSESMWDKGYRPAWMLSDSRDPPEKYIDAQKMYKTYMETGEVVYPKEVLKGRCCQGNGNKLHERLLQLQEDEEI